MWQVSKTNSTKTTTRLGVRMLHLHFVATRQGYCHKIFKWILTPLTTTSQTLRRTLTRTGLQLKAKEKLRWTIGLTMRLTKVLVMATRTRMPSKEETKGMKRQVGYKQRFNVLRRRKRGRVCLRLSKPCENTHALLVGICRRSQASV